MTEELFRMVGISKSFQGVKALDKVSLSVNKGEVHGLVGENGAGKSTLMKVMSGVYQEDEGEIFIEGQKVEINNVARAHELGVAIIFQELNLLPHMNVADNIYIGRQPKKGLFVDDKKMHEDAKAVLDDLEIDIDTNTTVSSLSVAQQQMIEIAKAISMDTKILVLDEPSAALTDKEIDQLFVIIKRLQKKGVGMVYISHRMVELEELCERVTIIRDGQYIDTVNLGNVTMDEVVNMMVGRLLDDKYPKYDRTIGEVKLELRNLKQGKKLNIKNLVVHKGEILGVAGLVGSGRTETARCIFGADSYDEMELYIDGEKVQIKSVEDAMQYGMGYVTEDRKFDGLCLPLDVNYNTNLAHLKLLSKKGIIDDKKAEENAIHYKEALRIKTPTINERVKNLSGGNQQKIVLAKWLSNDIDILICDEPTRGIDVGSKYEIYELLNELSDKGVAIIMISSELPEVLGMSDRVAVIHEGEIAKILNTKETTQEEILTYAAGYDKLEDKK